jgi:hypothetical protein
MKPVAKQMGQQPILAFAPYWLNASDTDYNAVLRADTSAMTALAILLRCRVEPLLYLSLSKRL